jgi:hypothetical protein
MTDCAECAENHATSKEPSRSNSARNTLEARQATPSNEKATWGGASIPLAPGVDPGGFSGAQNAQNEPEPRGMP